MDPFSIMAGLGAAKRVVSALPWKAILIGIAVVVLLFYMFALRENNKTLASQVVAEQAKTNAARVAEEAAYVARDLMKEAADNIAKIANENARAINTLQAERQHLMEAAAEAQKKATERKVVYVKIKEETANATAEDRPVGPVLFRGLSRLYCAERARAGDPGFANCAGEAGQGSTGP
jgi:cell division septum initiation protein DivIVA